jgi:hypothetical protein
VSSSEKLISQNSRQEKRNKYASRKGRRYKSIMNSRQQKLKRKCILGLLIPSIQKNGVWEPVCSALITLYLGTVAFILKSFDDVTSVIVSKTFFLYRFQPLETLRSNVYACLFCPVVCSHSLRTPVGLHM